MIVEWGDRLAAMGCVVLWAGAVWLTMGRRRPEDR